MIRRLAVVTAAVLAATAAPAVAADQGWDVPSSATITIDGHGHGHDRGLSQLGARQRAEDGADYRDILGFYYPGTDWGTATGQVRVWISEGDRANALQVAPRKGLVARRVGTAKVWDLTRAQPKALGWRILPKGDHASVLQYRKRGWHQLRRVSGLLEFAGKGRPIELATRHGKASYRGVLRSVPSSRGNRITVNVVPMDSYLRGVVPAEVVASRWPQQAQRAQAVAARSYAALKRSTRPDKPYDLDDTTRYQRYLGADAEYPASDQAVAATAGEILTYAGAPAFTEFTASNGGWTVAGDEPYLPAQEDPYDGDTWGPVTFSDSEIEAHWPEIGDLSRIEISGSDDHGDWDARAGTVTLTGGSGTVTVGGDAFAGTLHLQSSWLRIAVR